MIQRAVKVTVSLPHYAYQRMGLVWVRKVKAIRGDRVFVMWVDGDEPEQIWKHAHIAATTKGLMA